MMKWFIPIENYTIPNLGTDNQLIADDMRNIREEMVKKYPGLQKNGWNLQNNLIRIVFEETPGGIQIAVQFNGEKYVNLARRNIDKYELELDRVLFEYFDEDMLVE